MELRAPTIADAPVALDVLVAREMADIGTPDYVLGDLLDEWRATELDLTADSRVVELDGRIVAYAMVHGPITVAAVAPDYEGQGGGARLLEWTEEREREPGRSAHRQWIASGNERGKALLRAAGYELARSYWRMGLGLEDLRDHPQTAPDAIRLRPLDVEQDAVTLHAIDDAGFLLARRRTDAHVGYVDILAVHPDHQGKRIGTALLAEAFRLSAQRASKKRSSGSRRPTRGP
jgi:GNAT superfamily N-acetyltransferase